MPIDHDPIHNFLDRLLRSKKKHRERTPRNRSRKRKIPQKKPDTHIYGERSVDGSPFGTTDVFSVWFSNERRDAIEQRSVWSIGASATRARMGYVTWARASAGAAEGRESVDGSGVEFNLVKVIRNIIRELLPPHHIRNITLEPRLITNPTIKAEYPLPHRTPEHHTLELPPRPHTPSPIAPTKIPSPLQENK
ncbi:hypothetical protein M7I_8148 [Glarea lozoyensis 74030]|uniref:Uncharacterized protein n=1 Tax=Glarea lozoyensis (strain ATCC 74030 / MF5533) TaxID=1104152 RepID=H0EZ85_GLAL7|nr:hypothetical protein M7I_8148 [Glarea lozoyensis 74030]